MKLKLISEELGSSSVSGIISESHGGEKQYYIQGVFGQAEVRNGNGRVYPLDILTEAVERFQKVIDGGHAYGECDHPACQLSRDFEILTSTGWKSYDEASVGELAMSLSPSGEIEYKPIIDKINAPFKGKGYHLKSNGIDISHTFNHDLVLKNRSGKMVKVSVGEVFANRQKYNKHYIVKRSEPLIFDDSETFTIKGVSVHNPERYDLNVQEDLVIDKALFSALCGIYLSEGCVIHGETANYSIKISQKKESIKQDIRQLIDDLGFSYTESVNQKGCSTFSITDRRLYEFFAQFGKSHEKYIHQDIKNFSAQYLEILIDWFIKGDGRTYKNYPSLKERGSNRRNLFSVSKRLVDDLHECLVKTGGSGTIHSEICSSDYMFAGHEIKASNKRPLYVLEISSSNGIYLDERFLKMTEIDHDGDVYSFTVADNHNYYIRDAGGKSYWTGNCLTVSMQNASHRITKLWMEGNNMMGRAIIMPNEKGNVLISALKTGGRIPVSTRGAGQLDENNKVKKGFRLVTVDAVANPSAPSAFTNGIYEGKEFLLEGDEIVEERLNDIGLVRSPAFTVLNRWIQG